MKKIDIKARMEEKVRSTEWTDSNTWNVLDRIRKAKSAPRFRWSPALLPAAAVLVLVVCLGVTSVFGPKGGPDQIRNHNLHTLQPVTTSLSQGDGQEGEGPASPDTVLYYNPDGGSKYHLDPNCKSVLPKYQPLEGQFTYAEVNDEQYLYLEPCRICSAPGRSPDTAGDLPAQDSAGQADTEADAVTAEQADKSLTDIIRTVQNGWYANIADELIPVNLSCEDQGIRFEVISALVKGNESWVVCSLQDLEGDRVNESTVDSAGNDSLGTVYSYGNTLLDYDPEAHKVIYIRNINYRQLTSPEDGMFALSYDYVYTDEDAPADLLPLLKEYGKAVEGIRPPEGLTMLGAQPVPDDVRVLDYNDPLMINLNERGNVILTGIGWIGDQLHIQIFQTGNPMTAQFSMTRTIECEPRSDFPSAGLILNTWNMYRDGMAGNVEERIFNVKPDNKYPQTLTADIVNITSWVDGHWEIRVPLSSVMQHAALQPYGEHVVEELSRNDQLKGILNDLKPVDLSCEAQGVRLNVHAMAMLENEEYILYSLQYPEGTRSAASSSSLIRWQDSLGMPCYPEYTWGLVYDEEARQSTSICRFKVRDGSSGTSLADVCPTIIGLDSVPVSRKETVDILPLVKEHAAETHGIKAPEYIDYALIRDENGEWINGSREVLDYNHPMNIPLSGDVSLSGIGWIDGKLHIQVHALNQVTYKISYETLKRWDTSIEAVISAFENYDYAKYYPSYSSWGQSGSSVPEWFEYVLDIDPENLDQTELTLSVMEITEFLQDKWSINLPLPENRTDSDPVPALADSPVSSSEAGTGSKSAPVAGESNLSFTVFQTASQGIFDPDLSAQFPDMPDELIPINLSCEDQGIRFEVLSGIVKEDQASFIYSLQPLEGNRVDFSSFLQYNLENNISEIYSRSSTFSSLAEDEETHKHIYRVDYKYDKRINPLDGQYTLGIRQIKTKLHYTDSLIPSLKEYGKEYEGINLPEKYDLYRIYMDETQLENLKILDYTRSLNIPLKGSKKTTLSGIGWIDGKLHVQTHTVQDSDPSYVASLTQGHGAPSYSFSRISWSSEDGTESWDEYILDDAPEDMESAGLNAEITLTTSQADGKWIVRFPAESVLADSDKTEPESAPVSSPAAEEPAPEETALTQSILNSIQYDYPEIMDKLQPVNLSREDRGIRLDVHYIAWADNQEYVIFSLQDLEENRDGEMEAAGFSNIRYTGCTEGQVKRSSRYHTPGFNNMPGYNDHPIYVQVLSTLRKNPDGTSVEAYPSALNLDHIAISKSQTLNVLPMVKEYAAAVEGMESPKLLPSSNLLDPSSSETSHIWTNYPQEKATVLDYTRPLDIPLYGTVSLTGAGWIDGKLHVQTHNEDTELFSVSGRHRLELSDSADLQAHSHNCQLKWGDNDDDAPEWREYIFDVSPEDLEQADDLHLYVTEYTDYLQGDWTIPLPRPEGVPETESSPAAEEPVPEETPVPQQNISRAESPDGMFPINLSGENQGIRFELIAGKVDNDSATFRLAVEDLEGRYAGLQLDPSFRFDNIATFHDAAYSPTDDKDSEHRKLFDISPKFEEPVDPAPRDITARMDSLLIEDKASIDVVSLLEQYGQSAEGIAPPKAVRTYYNRSVAIPEDLKVLDYTNPLNIPLLEDVYLTGIGWINGRLHIQLHNTNPAHIYRGSTDYTKWHVYISGAEYPDYAPVKWSEDGSDDAAWVECILDTAPETVSMEKPVLFLTVVRDVLKDDAWSITVPLDSVWAGSTETAEIREEPASAADIADTADSVPADTPDAIPAGYNNIVNAKNQLLRFFCDWAQGDMDSLVGETTVAWRLATEDHAAALAKLTAGVPLSFQVNSLASDPGSSDQVADCVVKMDPLDGSEPRYERIQIRLRNEEDDSHYEVVPESLAAREPAQLLPDKETVPLSEEAITNFNLDTYFSGVRENLIPVNLSQEAQGIRITVISALVKEQESWIVYSLEDLEGRCSGCDFYHDSLDTSDIGNFKSFSSFPLYSSARQHKAVLMDHVRFDSPVDTSDRVIHIRKSSLRNYKSRFMDFAPLIAQYAVTTEGVDRPAGNGYVNPEADVPKVLDWSNSLDIPVTKDGFLSAIGWIDGRLHIQFRTTNTFSFHNAMFTEYNGGKAKTKYWNDGNTRVYWRDGDTRFIEHVINYQPADPENTHLEGCLDYTEELLPRLNLTVEVPLSSILAD